MTIHNDIVRDGFHQSHRQTRSAAKKDGGDRGLGKDGTTVDDDDARRRRPGSRSPRLTSWQRFQAGTSSSKLVRAAAPVAGCAADKGDRKNGQRWKPKKETGPDTAKPVSNELGRETTGNADTRSSPKLRDGPGGSEEGELNAAAQQRRRRDYER